MAVKAGPTIVRGEQFEVEEASRVKRASVGKNPLKAIAMEQRSKTKAASFNTASDKFARAGGKALTQGFKSVPGSFQPSNWEFDEGSDAGMDFEPTRAEASEKTSTPNKTRQRRKEAREEAQMALPLGVATVPEVTLKEYIQNKGRAATALTRAMQKCDTVQSSSSKLLGQVHADTDRALLEKVQQGISRTQAFKETEFAMYLNQINAVMITDDASICNAKLSAILVQMEDTLKEVEHLSQVVDAAQEDSRRCVKNQKERARKKKAEQLCLRHHAWEQQRHTSFSRNSGPASCRATLWRPPRRPGMGNSTLRSLLC